MFGYQNSGSGSVLSLKCWIRLRHQRIRIRNTALCHVYAVNEVHIVYRISRRGQQIPSKRRQVYYPIYLTLYSTDEPVTSAAAAHSV
jgi:hypothetical protein